MTDITNSLTCFLFYQVTEITTSVIFMPCVSSVDNFLIFVFLGLENNEIDSKIVFSCVNCIKEIKRGHGNRDVTVTFQVTCALYINNFLIFDIPDLKYGEIDTKIDLVSFVLGEIQQVTEIMMLQLLSRSRASDTSFPFLFSSSLISDIVTSTPRLSL